jgi:hypothetical protein
MKKTALISVSVLVCLVIIPKKVLAISPSNNAPANSDYKETRQEMKPNFQNQIQLKKDQLNESKQNHIEQRQQIRTQRNEALSQTLHNRVRSTNNKISARAGTLLLIASKINERILDLSYTNSVDMSEPLSLVAQSVSLIEESQLKIEELNKTPDISDTQDLKVEMQNIKTEMHVIIQDLSSARLLLKQSIFVAKSTASQVNTTLPSE